VRVGPPRRSEYARAVPASLDVEVGRHVAQLERDERGVHRWRGWEERRAHDQPSTEESAVVEGRLIPVTRIGTIDRGVVVAQDPSTKTVELVGRDALDVKSSSVSCCTIVIKVNE